MSCHPHTINDTKKDRNIETMITPSFYPMIRMPDTVRTWIIPISLMMFFFFLPLQCFIIGDNLGLGVQGAIYRYQITGSGNSLIPITYEIGYVASGLYQEKTAFSVILWVSGTLVLVCTLIHSLIHMGQVNDRLLRLIIEGIGVSCILYLASLVVQYGIFFSGPAGISLPAGILLMALFAGFMHHYWNSFTNTNLPTKITE